MTFVLLTGLTLVLLALELPLATRKDPRWGLAVPLALLILSVADALLFGRYLSALPDVQPTFLSQMRLLTFLFANLPTAGALALYALGRWRVRKQK